MLLLFLQERREKVEETDAVTIEETVVATIVATATAAVETTEAAESLPAENLRLALRAARR